MMKLTNFFLFLFLLNCDNIDSALITNKTVPTIFDIILPYLRLNRLQVFQGSKCFNNLGCFNAREVWHPVNRPLSFTPEDPEAIGTKFYLFTDANQIEPQLVNSDNVTGSKFNPKFKVIMVTHGYYYDNFFGQYQKVAFAKLRKAIYSNGKVNYIFVDWGRGATTWYVQATANTRVVGAQIAEFIQSLMKIYKLSPLNFHLIGHSLGAHVVGYAGSVIKNLDRITGLDPAKPYFEDMPARFRLDRSDANFVEVIHTNSPRKFHPFGFGTAKIVGHLDYYPNGGNAQPGCHQDNVDALNTGLENGIQRAGICNHERSILFWAESLEAQRCRMISFGCESYEKFRSGDCYLCGENGENCAIVGSENQRMLKKSQKFFLLTTANAPFCVYHFRVSLNLGQFPELVDSSKGQLTVNFTDDTSSTAVGRSELVPLNPNSIISFLAIGDEISTIRKLAIIWTQNEQQLTKTNLLIKSMEIIPMNLWNDQLKVSRTTSIGSFKLEPFREKIFTF